MKKELLFLSENVAKYSKINLVEGEKSIPLYDHIAKNNTSVNTL